MASITVVYDSIEGSIPKIESLSDECNNLAGKIGEVSGELESIGKNHDESCFSNSITAIDILSTFVGKMGAEYDAIASFAKTSVNTFKESEGKIIAETAKVEDMKTMLSYLGMSEASVRALDFNNINGYKTMDDYNKADDDHKANISLYEEYYKDTNADLGIVTESAILDMMVTSDGKGSYRTITTEEMKKYIEERAKAQVSSEAESIVTGPSSDRTVSSAAAFTSGVASSATPMSTPMSKPNDKAQEDKDKAKSDEDKAKDKSNEDKAKDQENKVKSENDDNKNKTEENKAKNQENEKKLEDNDKKAKEEKTDNKKDNKQETIVKYVEAKEPKTAKAATNNAQSVGNAVKSNEEATVPVDKTGETPIEPNDELTVDDEPITDDTIIDDEPYDTTSDEPTTQTTVPLPTTKNNNNTSSSSSAIPAIAGIATAAAAGIGTKIYLDKKANNDENYEGEDEEEYSYDYDDSDSITTASDGAYIQSPDSTWDSGQEESDLKY